MLLRLLFVIALCVPSLATSLHAATPPEVFVPQQRQAPAQETHWAIRLGTRIKQTDEAFPIIDRVVLVPDAATYLDELARWSPDGRWPVLIEDDRYAQMFIRRFRPAEVIRRDSVGELPNGEQAQREHIEKIIVRTWGGDPSSHTPAQAFAARDHEPPGVVIASMSDPAWAAAIALAAGRGQPLAWMDGNLRGPNATLRPDAGDELARTINELVAAQGYPYEALGDAIDTITICRSMPGRVNRTPRAGGDPEPAAITDFLGRNPDGSRYAIVGWIFGDEIRSAYIAMCSLFLPRESIRLYNTYPDDGPWQVFNIDGAGGLLAQRGFDVTTFNGPRASENGWVNMIRDGLTVDIFAINTKGHADFFDLSNARVTTNDVPILNHPAVVHFTHSFAMQAPANEETIAGRFLERGAYGFVGSVHEPSLAAFQPPLALAERWAKGAPVLVAARHLEDHPALQSLGGPWRVNTFGDPLMLAIPAAHNARQRIATKAEYGENLGEAVRQRMRAIDEEGGPALADSIAMLERLGRDAIAVQLWRLAEQRELTAYAAAPALGPLFREGAPDEFFRAWQESGRRDALAVDLLWHKMTPALAEMRDEDALMQLQGLMRRPLVYGDLTRLAPALRRAFGMEHARQVIDSELDRAENRRVERELRRLRQRY